MDSRLLDDHSSALRSMRALAGELASAYPRIAGRLGMQGGEVADPYIQPLIEPGRFSETGYRFYVAASNAVIRGGLSAKGAVMQLASRQFLGRNLVHEYFACPERFCGFTLMGLQAAFSRIDGCEAEVIVLLDNPASGTTGGVDTALGLADETSEPHVFHPLHSALLNDEEHYLAWYV